MTLTLLPAATQDAPAIAAILSGWIDETPWMPRVHSAEETEAFGALRMERTVVTVACLEGAVAGFLALRPPMIEAFYIATPARGRGLGRSLLDHAKTSETALELWTFQANTAARTFYAHAGFTENRETDGAANDEKLPDVYMSWRRQ